MSNWQAEEFSYALEEDSIAFSLAIFLARFELSFWLRSSRFESPAAS